MGIKQTRLFASQILKTGKNKVWLDPAELTTIKNAVSREKVQELINDNLIIKKPNNVHSKFHTRKRQLEVSKGRHRGTGKVHGKKTCLDPPKKKWILKIRQLRLTLKDLRQTNYITKTEYKKLYLQAKGNFFKNNKIMVELIAKKKDDEKRMRDLTEQAAALQMENE